MPLSVLYKLHGIDDVDYSAIQCGDLPKLLLKYLGHLLATFMSPKPSCHSSCIKSIDFMSQNHCSSHSLITCLTSSLDQTIHLEPSSYIVSTSMMLAIFFSLCSLNGSSQFACPLTSDPSFTSLRFCSGLPHAGLCLFLIMHPPHSRD